MGLTPLLNSAHVVRTSEVVLVLRFLEPAPLARYFAGLAAFRFGAELLSFDVARVRKEENRAIQTLTFSDSSCHWPLTSRTNDRVNGTILEENNGGRKEGKKKEETI
jgi:hypothetical protein